MKALLAKLGQWLLNTKLGRKLADKALARIFSGFGN